MHEQWNRLLDYARYAPSPHNIQAWKIRLVSEDTAILLFDPQRLLPGTDPTGRFTAAGFGIFCEMLDVAAAAEGLKLNTEYFGVPLDPNKTQPTEYAKLTLTARTEPEEYNRELIKKRRTSRLPYKGDTPVPTSVLQELRTIAAKYGHTLEVSVDPKEVAWVVELNADTMFFDMRDPVARNEVGGWIRYSYEEAVIKADGLAAYAMGFAGPLMKAFVKANWFFSMPGLYHIIKAHYVKSMAGTNTVSWISGAFETPEDWDNTGRMLARLWLCMTKHGIYLHPFGSVITNKEANARMTEHFANPNRKHPLWLLMRMGYSDIPPKSQRLPLSKIVIQ